MTYCPTILKQVLDLINPDIFTKMVKRYNGDYRVRKLTCWNHFVCLLYAQIKQKASLRDIETSLETQEHALYHLGIGSIKRSSISDANLRRNHCIYRDLFFSLLKEYHQYDSKKLLFGKKTVALDATVIQLCATLYPWSKFQKKKGGINLHFSYDIDACSPEFFVLSDGNSNEKKHVRDIPLQSDSIIVFDRGYQNHKWYQELTLRNITFVTRTSKTTAYTLIGQLNLEDASSHILADERVKPTFIKYKGHLRRIRYRDPETDRIYEFLTNNFEFEAQKIAAIYKKRWDIENFFKWIKQHLKMKTFLGTSPNAVLSQIWVGLIAYMLLKLIKKQFKSSKSILTLARIISESAFTRRSILFLLEKQLPNNWTMFDQQSLFGFT